MTALRLTFRVPINTQDTAKTSAFVATRLRKSTCFLFPQAPFLTYITNHFESRKNYFPKPNDTVAKLTFHCFEIHVISLQKITPP